MDFAKWVSFSAVIIFIYILWQIKKLVLLVFTAMILALVLNIFVKKLSQLGIKRSYGMIISLLALLLTIVLLTILVIPSLFLQFQQLYFLVPQGLQQIIFQADKIKDSFPTQISALIPNFETILSQIQPLIEDLLTKGVSLISGFFGSLLSSLLLLALTLMFLADPIAYEEGFISFCPAFYRKRIKNILDKISRQLEGWLINTFIKIIGVFLLTYICLVIFDIPLVLPQVFLASFLVITPYIGIILSLISPMAIAFLGSPFKPWLILISYFLIDQFIDRILIPRLRNKKQRIRLIPANVIIGEVVFASFLGLLGLFLAIPLTIISQNLIKEILIKDIFDHWKVNEP